MNAKYNSDLAKCLEELAKSITEFENLQYRLDEDIRWLKSRLDNDANIIPEVEPILPEERAKMEQDLAQAVLLKDFVESNAKCIEGHAAAITNKLLNKEGA